MDHLVVARSALPTQEARPRTHAGTYDARNEIQDLWMEKKIFLQCEMKPLG
jgi:hypothetical protein